MQNESQNDLFWSYDIKDIENNLGTSIESGLDESEVKSRLKKWGANIFGQTKKFSKVKIFSSQFKSPLIFILIIAAITTIFLREWLDASIIILAITVNVILGFYQENKAENSLLHLRSYIKERTRIIRNGKEKEIDPSELVAGDLIHLMSGNRVPADARIVFSNNLSVDESILTGESLSVSKSTEVLSEAAPVSDRKNMVFGGTLITNGSGMAIVVLTGNKTEIGKIANLVSETHSEKTPLQKAVSQLAWIIAIGLLGIVIGIFFLGIRRGEPVFDIFLTSIAVMVGAIPEALPIGLTAVLAVGVERLAKKKGIMRNLSAAETLGSTSVIMTDKTGTLTEAKMNLVNIFSKDNLLTEEKVYSISERISAQQKNILLLASMNTDVLVENPQDEPEQWIISGNALENNIVKSAGVHELPVDFERQNGKFKIILPFNSKNKFSVSIGKTNININSEQPDRERREVQIILGAPDILLKKSDLNKKEYLELVKKVEQLSYEGKRLLGVAIKETSPSGSLFNLEEIDDIKFVGVLAFFDPIRESVKDAITTINNLGVKVVMATGDLRGTAVAVANSLGWDVKDNQVLSGEEIRQMSDDELIKALPLARVFARVTPEDKLRIEQLYKKTGEVVAMTGDGVNDAPSLKAVDIGIAVGSGTDVAKGVADLVLLDDNFETIVSAIEEGKRMLKNIRKIFVYLMSNSLDEVLLIGGSLIVGIPLPLTAIQIIWVNFFTGSIPAIAFAFDDEDKTKRNNKFMVDKKILNPEVKFLTLGIGVINSILLFGMYWGLVSLTSFDIESIRAFVFVCFASYILFVAFSLRNLEKSILSYNLFSNKFLVFGIALGMVSLLSTIYIPFLQNIFQVTDIGLVWIFFAAIWVLINMVLVETAKWIFYREK